MKVTYLINNIDLFTHIYRVYNIRNELEINGINCLVLSDQKVSDYDKCYESDIVILCRIRYTEEIDKLILNLHKKNIPVVYDIDDLVFDVQYIEFLGAVRDSRPGAREELTKVFSLIYKVLIKCDAVTCSTNQLRNILLKYNKPVYTIPNTIGRKQLVIANDLIKNKTKNEKVRIGYFSGTRTHNSDFLEVAGILKEILEQYKNVELHLFGELEPPQFLSNKVLSVIPHLSTSHSTMLVNLASMDINLAPLQMNNIFNSCKSELKIFEAATVEVPTVASHIEVYASVIEDTRDGFLAANKDDWAIALQLLIENTDLRKNMGIKSKEKCIKMFYVENIIDEIINIYRLITQ